MLLNSLHIINTTDHNGQPLTWKTRFEGQVLLVGQFSPISKPVSIDYSNSFSRTLSA